MCHGHDVDDANKCIVDTLYATVGGAAPAIRHWVRVHPLPLLNCAYRTRETSPSLTAQLPSDARVSP